MMRWQKYHKESFAVPGSNRCLLISLDFHCRTGNPKRHLGVR